MALDEIEEIDKLLGKLDEEDEIDKLLNSLPAFDAVNEVTPGAIESPISEIDTLLNELDTPPLTPVSDTSKKESPPFSISSPEVIPDAFSQPSQPFIKSIPQTPLQPLNKESLAADLQASGLENREAPVEPSNELILAAIGVSGLFAPIMSIGGPTLLKFLSPRVAGFFATAAGETPFGGFIGGGITLAEELLDEKPGVNWKRVGKGTLWGSVFGFGAGGASGAFFRAPYTQHIEALAKGWQTGSKGAAIRVSFLAKQRGVEPEIVAKEMIQKLIDRSDEIARVAKATGKTFKEVSDEMDAAFDTARIQVEEEIVLGDGATAFKNYLESSPAEGSISGFQGSIGQTGSKSKSSMLDVYEGLRKMGMSEDEALVQSGLIFQPEEVLKTIRQVEKGPEFLSSSKIKRLREGAKSEGPVFEREPPFKGIRETEEVEGFVKKMVRVAKEKGTTPEKLNLKLTEKAKAKGTTRGEELAKLDPDIKTVPIKDTRDIIEAPPIIRETAEDVVEAEKIFTKVNKHGIPFTREDDLLDGSFAADFSRKIQEHPELQLENMKQRAGTTGEGTPPAVYVDMINRANGEVFSDGKLNRMLQALKESSDAFNKEIPSDIVGEAIMSSKGRDLGFFTKGRYFAKLDPENSLTPEGALRDTAIEMMQMEKIMGDMIVKSSEIARRIQAGEKGLEGQYGNLIENIYRVLDKTMGVRSESGRLLRSLRFKRAPDAEGLQRMFFQQVRKFAGGDALNPAVLKRMADLDLFDPIARQKFLASVYNPRLRQYVDEAWFNGILSLPTTQIRNMSGNIGAAFIRELERPIAAGANFGRTQLARASNAVFGTSYNVNRTKFFGESPFLRRNKFKAIGFLEAWGEANAVAVNTWKTERSKFGFSTKLELNENMIPAFRGSILSNIRTSGRTLLMVDDWFKMMAYRSELNALAYRKAVQIGEKEGWTSDQMAIAYRRFSRTPSRDLIAGAAKEAHNRTFTTKPGDLGRTLMNARRAAPGMEFLMPFLRTPINIGEFALDRVPLYNIATMLNRRRQGLPIDIDEEIAKNVIGIATMGVVYKKATDTFTVGEGDDAYQVPFINGKTTRNMTPTERTDFYAQGRRDYAVNFPVPEVLGGGFYALPFSNLMQPFSIFVGISSDLVDAKLAWEKDPENNIWVDGTDMMNSIIFKFPYDNISQQTFAKSLMVFTQVISGEAGREKSAIQRLVSSFVPIFPSSIAGGVARALDDRTLRKSEVLVGQHELDKQDFLDRTLHTLKTFSIANIPPLPDWAPEWIPNRSDLTPVFSMWGEKVITAKGAFSRMLEAAGVPQEVTQLVDTLFDPTSISSLLPGTDPATREVTRVMQGLAVKDFPPGSDVAIRGFGDTDTMITYLGELTQDQYTEYAQTYRRLSHKWISETIEKDFYKSLITDGNFIKRAEILSRLRIRAQKQVRREMFGIETREIEASFKEKEFGKGGNNLREILGISPPP